MKFGIQNRLKGSSESKLAMQQASTSKLFGLHRGKDPEHRKQLFQRQTSLVTTRPDTGPRRA